MNIKKRALHLAVTAGMVGSMVAVAAPSAHAAGVLPDFCGVYLQGNVDPAGGLIPAGLIPFPVGGNGVGQKAYALLGHEAKGQEKILNDLNNTTLKGTRFKLGVKLGGTITATTRDIAGASWAGGTATYTTTVAHGLKVGDIVSISKVTPAGYNLTNVAVTAVGSSTDFDVALVGDPGVWVKNGVESRTEPIAPLLGNVDDSTSQVKIQWKNDANGLGPKVAQVQVAEKGPVSKPKISKGFVTSIGAVDQLGVQTGTINDGNNGTGPGPIAGSPGPASSSVFGVYVPPAAANGTYKLSMAFPSIAPPPLTGVTLTTAAIAYNASAATIAAALNAAPVFGGLGGGVVVTAGALPGQFTVSFAATALANQALPSLSALAADQTGALATTVADDGSLHNAWRNGGVDPGISPVSSLGNGIFTSQGMMASGDIPVIGQKNSGKWFTTPDVQYLFLHYPADLVTALVPGLSTAFVAQGLLQSIVGPNLTVTLDPCGLLGILGLFCTAASASIPPAFLGICGLL